MPYRRLVTLVLLLLLTVSAMASPGDSSDKDKDKNLSVGGVKPGQSRSSVESALGAPIYSEVGFRSFHYSNGVIVIYDGSDQVLSVHGPELDLDGKNSWITSRQALEKELGTGTEGKAGAAGQTLVFSTYGLTAYLHDDGITGFLLEPARH